MTVADITTKTGCRTRLHEVDAESLVLLHGPGLLLTLDMDEEGDRRHAEVYLDDDALVALYEALDGYVMRR